MTLKEDLSTLDLAGAGAEAVLTLISQTPKKKLREICQKQFSAAHQEYEALVASHRAEYCAKQKVIDTELNSQSAAAYESHRAKSAALEHEYAEIYSPYYDAYKDKCRVANEEFTKERNALEAEPAK